jgi:hypothetical protein
MRFIDLLNQTYVVFVPDLTKYGWAGSWGTSGFEACSPTGEIRAFRDWKAANAWRLAEVRILMSNGWR